MSRATYGRLFARMAYQIKFSLFIGLKRQHFEKDDVDSSTFVRSSNRSALLSFLVIFLLLIKTLSKLLSAHWHHLENLRNDHGIASAESCEGNYR